MSEITKKKRTNTSKPVTTAKQASKASPAKPKLAKPVAAARNAGRASRAKSRATKPAAVPRGNARRKTILRALHTCVLEKGYAKTTLADVADEAKMYPSHLLYYFNGKEAILEQYFQEVSEKILERLASFVSAEPRRQVDFLSSLFFASEGIKKSEIGFMLECFGVAVNDNVLREEKSTLDRQCKEYLVQLFDQTAGRIMKSSNDCAEIAYAMLIGLRSAVYFDEKLDLPDAYRLFHTSVLHMTGMV